jgi:hypothetical protein
VTSSAYLFAHDVLDETAPTVLQRLEQAGLNEAVMATAYHHSRDVFPHNPRRNVEYLEGGTVYFRPDFARYSDTRLIPRVAAIAGDRDPLGALCDEAQRRGMRVSAWMVMLHNTRLAFEAPDCAPVTALGDPLLNCLCPANPSVRAFAEALAGDVARYDLESIKLEALSYMGFDHGYHHERSFIPLSPNIRFLLGLCFCTYCLANAGSTGVDVERVHKHVAAVIASVLESSRNETNETELEESKLRDECDGELGRFLNARLDVITSLAERVSAAVHAVAPATRVVFLDPSGATLGYATGTPATDNTATSIAWRDGIDLSAVAQRCDGLGMLGYFADPRRLELEVEAYRHVLPDSAPLEVLLRPMAPDSRGADELAAKVDVLRRQGIRDIAFYHYGMMRLEALGWIAHSLAYSSRK